MKHTGDFSLTRIFQQIPMLRNYHPDDFSITDLAGYTNKNYHLKNDTVDVILRLPRTETNLYINRTTEFHNEQIAYKLGLAPPLLWHNDKGESLRKTVIQSNTLTSIQLKDTDIIKLLAKGVQQLHHSQKEFQGQVNLQELLNRYFELLNNGQQNKYRLRFTQAQARLKTLDQENQRLVPSHNDLNEKNLLLDKQNRLWFIDWEYSSMASPYWDLATICNAGEFQSLQCQQLLDNYNHEQKSLTLQKLQYYREILSVLNDCWMNFAASFHNGQE